MFGSGEGMQKLKTILLTMFGSFFRVGCVPHASGHLLNQVGRVKRRICGPAANQLLMGMLIITRCRHAV